MFFNHDHIINPYTMNYELKRYACFYKVIVNELMMLWKENIDAVVKWFFTYYDDPDCERYFLQIFLHLWNVFSSMLNYV